MQRQLAIAAIAVGFLALTSSGVRGAGTNAAEETTIRKIIAAGKIQRMPDDVEWAFITKRPTIGNEKGELLSGSTVPNRVPGSTKTETDPIRIVVADSRDLAYEYSKSTVKYDLKSGEHVSFDVGLLGVWQKQGADWKIAATFQRPYDVDIVRTQSGAPRPLSDARTPN